MTGPEAVAVDSEAGERLAVVTTYESAHGARLVGLVLLEPGAVMSTAKAHELGCVLIWACSRGLADHPNRLSDPDL